MEEFHSEWHDEKPSWNNVTEALETVWDLDPSSSDRTVLLHQGLPDEIGDTELALYLQVLIDMIEFSHRKAAWSGWESSRVVAVFPEKKRQEIERLLAEYPSPWDIHFRGASASDEQ